MNLRKLILEIITEMLLKGICKRYMDREVRCTLCFERKKARHDADVSYMYGVNNDL